MGATRAWFLRHHAKKTKPSEPFLNPEPYAALYLHKKNKNKKASYCPHVIRTFPRITCSIRDAIECTYFPLRITASSSSYYDANRHWEKIKGSPSRLSMPVPGAIFWQHRQGMRIGMTRCAVQKSFRLQTEGALECKLWRRTFSGKCHGEETEGKFP